MDLAKYSFAHQPLSLKKTAHIVFAQLNIERCVRNDYPVIIITFENRTHAKQAAE